MIETKDSGGTYELVRALRARLHDCPESSGREEKTMELLKGFLRQNTTLELIDCGSWFYGVHQEEKAQRSIAFRADMDAVTGADGRPFHGCGHDGHSAVLAGLCLLAEGKKLNQNVYFIFQPAEETGEGGRVCSKLLAEKGIERVYAFHNLPGYPLGTAVLRRGTFACASKGVILNLKGRQCHAAYPEQGMNPALLIGEIICRLKEFTERPEYKGRVLATVICVQVGEEAFGVSPGKGRLALTIRAERLCDLTALENQILTYGAQRAKEQGLTLEWTFQDEFPDTVNDPDEVEECRRLFESRRIPYTEALEPLRWSEDFGWYLKEAKGMYFGVGAGEEALALHTPEYEFPDEIIPAALACFEAILLTNTGK